MARGSPWPEEHLDLLRRAVLEKEMPLSALVKLFPGKTPHAIRSQLSRQGLPIVSENKCTPDIDFFNSFGSSSPSLKVV
jgi:hypothetical protein